MKNEILDSNLISNRESDARPKFVNWISLIILWISILVCILNGFIGDIKVICGLILLLISTFSTYFKYETGVKITLGAIFLGVIKLVEYSYITIAFDLSIGPLAIGFDFLVLFIGIIHYFTNREVLFEFIRSILNKDIEKEEKTVNSGRVKGFKNRFAKKSTEELTTIIQENRLVPEALQAATELLKERENQT